jgi:hypothetical protein
MIKSNGLTIALSHNWFGSRTPTLYMKSPLHGVSLKRIFKTGIFLEIFQNFASLYKIYKPHHVTFFSLANCIYDYDS